MKVLTVTGRLATDPARRDTPNRVVCEFRLAVGGRPRLWLAVETWGHFAGRCARHLHSGRHVAGSGPLFRSEYVTRAGQPATRWYRAVTVSFLDRPDVDPVAVSAGVVS